MGAAAHSWSIIGFVHAWVSGDAVVFGTYLVSSALAMQTYGALAFGTGIFLILWNRDIFLRWRDKRRARSPQALLRRAHKIIVREFTLIEQDAEFRHTLARSPASKYAQREMLRLELLKCGVGAPDPASDSDETWYEFVTNLAPLSLHGHLQEARIRWPPLGQ